MSMSQLLPSSVPMPAITSVSQNETNGLMSNKVRLALLIGTPILLGSGLYIYYNYYHKSGQKDTKKSAKDMNNTNVKTVVDSRPEPVITVSLPPFLSISLADDCFSMLWSFNFVVSFKDPFKRAMNFKSKGNRFFKEGKYSDAIDCYTKAIEECPADKKEDLSTFYQNRAASYEMLKKHEEVIDDCTKAIDLNNRYVKALVRRAKGINHLMAEVSKLLKLRVG